MRHRVTRRKLGATTGHRHTMLRNLLTDLLRYGKLQTTEAKAREVRIEAEKLITAAKPDDVTARRKAASALYHPDAMGVLFQELVPRYADRHGGYTRLVKLGPRRGDGAPMAQIELVV